MITRTTPVAESLTPERFRDEILPGNRPVILKGLVDDWPIVRCALEGPESLIACLRSLDAGQTVEALISPPEVRGKFFYNADVTGFNYGKFQQRLSFALDWLMVRKDLKAEAGQCEAAAMQALVADRYFPGFMDDHRMPLLPDSVVPRFWIGNSVRVQTHYDILYNIACNVSGRRTFTLFPPDQLKNLYPGPLDLTLAGTPVSMVDVDRPDYGAFPLYRQAEAAAEIAVLEPGDALYLPYFWWHNVRSEGPVNVLVNYWWNDVWERGLTPYHAFYTALATLRHLPGDQQAAWGNLFDHYIFRRNGDPLSHLSDKNHGILGALPHEGRLRLNAFVLDMMREAADGSSNGHVAHNAD